MQCRVSIILDVFHPSQLTLLLRWSVTQHNLSASRSSWQTVLLLLTSFLPSSFWVLMNLYNPIVQLKRDFFFPPNSHGRVFHLWYSIFCFAQGSHFIGLHFCSDLGYDYSTISEEIDILVWRCKLFQDQLMLFVVWLINIGMCAIKHAIRNDSHGDPRYLKCVVNHKLQLIHDNWISERITLFNRHLLHHNW